MQHERHGAIPPRGGQYPNGQPMTLYAMSTGRHDIREYDVFESPQPWNRPTPVTTAEYAGKLAYHRVWRDLRINPWDTYTDIWKIFERSGIPHLKYWTGYHMLTTEEVEGVDAFFRYWCPGTPPTNTWERYWLRDSTAMCMTCSL
jgi:hypothetical protein